MEIKMVLFGDTFVNLENINIFPDQHLCTMVLSDNHHCLWNVTRFEHDNGSVIERYEILNNHNNGNDQPTYSHEKYLYNFESKPNTVSELTELDFVIGKFYKDGQNPGSAGKYNLVKADGDVIFDGKTQPSYG